MRFSGAFTYIVWLSALNLSALARPPVPAADPADAPKLSHSNAAASTTASGGSDNCGAAELMQGTGVFSFNNANATLDGPPHTDCHIFSNDQSQVDHDVWFCWFPPDQPCAGTYAISTCGRTSVDTRIAVYEGCACPVTDARLIDCRDDECETQTRVSFSAQSNQQYLIRLGTYMGSPGGSGTFSVSCDTGPPCVEPAGQCQEQNQVDALNSSAIAFLSAEGFTPVTDGTVSSICWWGAYLNSNFQNCEATSTDAFRVRYFDSGPGGAPGQLLATFSQQNGTLVVDTPYATGALINAVAPEYAFHASHAGLPVSSGSCYWVEISNPLTGCTWFWETSFEGDGRAFQDATPFDPYSPEDAVVNDLALCLNIPLNIGGPACLSAAPGNDACPNATTIAGPGTFLVDTSSATSQGPSHAECLSSGQTGFDHDVWYQWTSTCDGDVVVHTCDGTMVDTRLAVYSGNACPAASNAPITCDDDSCGQDGHQSMIVFPAAANQQFLVRVGSFPGAPGGLIAFSISCGAPDHPACGSTSSNADCCTASSTNSPGCGDESCCGLVCICDPFCCEVEWDSACADDGFGSSGCGASVLCGCAGICGNPTAGSCCSGHTPTPGCDDAECCEAICACDPFCCQTEWDENCAGTGFISGCGAEVLCADLCNPGCVHGDPCPDDGLECTVDICNNGLCTHPPRAAGTPCSSDGDACTTDQCNDQGDCAHDLICGACCDAAQCTDGLFENKCEALTGVFHQGRTCNQVPCAAVPAVSEWGLCILLLASLIAASILFSPRQLDSSV